MINKNTIAIAAAATAIAIAAGVAINKKFFANTKVSVKNLEKFNSATCTNDDLAEAVITTAFEITGREMKEAGVPEEQAMNFAAEVEGVLTFWRAHREKGAKVAYTKNKIGVNTITVSFSVVCGNREICSTTTEYKTI